MTSITQAFHGALVVLILTASSIGWAEEPASGKLVPRERPAQSVDNWSYRSASMERTYDISVGLPLSYEADPEKSWPAIVVLDGNRSFGMALDIARGLTGSGEIEDVFIVSIGTPYEEGPEAHTRRRVHEFSPDNDWPLTDPFGKMVKEGCEKLFKISLISEMHPGLGHTDAGAATLAIGLRRLYAKPPPQP